MSMDQRSPSTNFAGESGPHSSTNIAGGAIAIFFLLSPISILTAGLAFLLFSAARISYKVIISAVGIYAAILILSGNLLNSFYSYINSFLTILSIRDSESIAPAIFSALWQQLPLSLLIGGVVGAGYCFWRWVRRPTWKEFNFRLTPWEWLRKRKNISDIKTDKNGPADGRTLGINDHGDKIIQSEKEAVAHTLVVGAAGSGKTTTLMLGARDIIRRGEPLLFVDMKGSEDVPRILASYAKRYNRKFYHWTSQDLHEPYVGPSEDGPAFYDPLGRGNPTRRANLVIAGRDWRGTPDYFKITIQDYLQRAFQIIRGCPPEAGVDSLADISNMLDPQALKKRSLNLVGNPEYDNIIAEINYLTDKKIDGDTAKTLESMRRQLGVLRDSVQGNWLRKDPNNKSDINLFDIAHEGSVVVFTVDSANYEENARIVGNLIIQDLKTVSSELREAPSRYPLNVIIDEFSAIGSDNIIGLIARSRDAGIPVTLSTQSLGDLRAVSDSFLDQLMGIVLSFIIHRANTYENAEVYAGLSGKEEKTFIRENFEQTTSMFGGFGWGAGTGKGTLEVKEDFVVSPKEIQSLGQGQMVYICKAPLRIEHVQVITEDGKVAHSENEGKLIPAAVNQELRRATAPLVLNDGESIDDYKVDPSINGKPKYQDSDFDESTKADTQSIRHANPDRIREIFGKSKGDTEASKTVSEPRPQPAQVQPRPKPVLPPRPGLPELPESPNSKKPTAPVRSLGLPDLKPETLNSINALPKIEPEKRARPADAVPIRPRTPGSIALPVISLPNDKDDRKIEPVKEDPNAWD